MGHVECPQSEPANNDTQFTRPRLVPTTYCTRAWDRSRDSWPIFTVSKTSHFDPGVEGGGEVKPTISTPGKGVGRKSQCEPLVEVITAKVEVGLSAQRIYQNLMEENGFTDSYQSVKRFVRKVRAIQPERVWRLECQPGEELARTLGVSRQLVTEWFAGRKTPTWDSGLKIQAFLKKRRRSRG
jgi:DNA-binding XRE family transcriptional regulator